MWMKNERSVMQMQTEINSHEHHKEHNGIVQCQWKMENTICTVLFSILFRFIRIRIETRIRRNVSQFIFE